MTSRKITVRGIFNEAVEGQLDGRILHGDDAASGAVTKHDRLGGLQQR
jgi:hypothetical protein